MIALVAFAALSGAATPPVGACMRALWPALVAGPGLRDTAFAFEAVVQEVFFVFGPLIVAAIASLLAPWAAVMTAAALGLSGTVWFALAPAVRAVAPSLRSSRAGALASPALRTVMLSCVALGMAFGIAEVLMPAFGEAHQGRAQQAVSPSRPSRSAR